MTESRAMRLSSYLPSPTVIFMLALTGVLLGITLARGLQDPDYYWHLTTGRLIVEEGRIPSTDPFSFTWAGRPWTPHEWLSEVAIYWLVSAVGETAALAIFTVLAVASLAVFAVVLRRRGIRPAVIALVLTVAAIVFIPYVTLRPQVISWLMLAVVVVTLWQLRGERPAWSLVLVPLFVLWANLHGLWVVGLGVVALFTLLTLIGRTPMATARSWMLAAFVGCILASMATPAGPIGVLYPLRYINAGDWGLANIQEWQSPDFHEPASAGLLVLLLAIAVNGGRATPLWLSLLAYVGMAMALLALRNAPIAALFAIPTLALGLADRWPARRLREPSARVQVTRRMMEAVVATIVVAGAFVVLIGARPSQEGSDDPSGFALPVAGADHLERFWPGARVMGEYDWGGYLIYRLYDGGGRVFVDGRNDMYDDAILQEYEEVRAAGPRWEAIADRYGVNAILVAPSRFIARGPAVDAGWCEAYRDDVQVLLLRTCAQEG